MHVQIEQETHKSRKREAQDQSVLPDPMLEIAMEGPPAVSRLPSGQSLLQLCDTKPEEIPSDDSEEEDTKGLVIEPQQF